MTNEQQHLVFSTAQGFWACAYSLYMRIALDHPEIVDRGSDALPNGDRMDFFWRDSTAISTNLGFALELLLKIRLYQDSRRVYDRVSKTHSLCRVYDAMSAELKETLENLYQETLEIYGQMMVTFTYAISPNQLKQLSRKSDLYKPPERPQPKNLLTLRKLLDFTDGERLLYEKRYEAFNFDPNKWYPFFERLSPLFEFVAGLSRILKSSDGGWEYNEAQESDDEKPPLIYLPYGR